MGCCSNKPIEHENNTGNDEQRSMLNGKNHSTTKPNIGEVTDNHINGKAKKNKNKKNKKKNKSSDKNNKSKRYKLLLIGPGQSGKSTLFKQMRTLHGEQYSLKELMCSKYKLTANLIENFRKICIYTEILSDGEIGPSAKVLEENRLIRDKIAKMNEHILFTQEICNDFKKLLKDPGIQKTLSYRYRYQLTDNFDYLVENMHKYYKPDYSPTFDDYLNVQQRTVGVQRITFKLPSKTIDGVTEYYDIYDAGGQRNERKKWMKVISGSRAFIFVVAMSGYNQSLWEDPSYNRMSEAIHLFRRIYHMEALQNSHCILFLNKIDLFDKKIKKYPIKDTFNEYDGDGSNESVRNFVINKFKQQKHPRYSINSSISNHCHKADNIKSDKNHSKKNHSRQIYTHFTCATDTECVNKVFEFCRDIMVVRALNAIGFL